MVRDFRYTDWGQPENASSVTSSQGNPEQEGEDFRQTDWGMPGNATVTTPSAETTFVRPADDGSKEDWERYATSRGFDTTGMTKKQIVLMVEKEDGTQPEVTDQT